MSCGDLLLFTASAAAVPAASPKAIAVTVTRVGYSETVPARFALAATGNLCPCGGLPPEFPVPEGRTYSACHCKADARQRYLAKISGPIVDLERATPPRGSASET